MVGNQGTGVAEWKGWKPVEQRRRFVGKSDLELRRSAGDNTPFGLLG